MIRIVIFFLLIYFPLFSKDYNSYIRIVDVNGEVKILSSKSIVKPANFDDLLFSRDNIITENNANITSYLENKFLFKVKENSSIELLETYDKKGNIHIKLLNGVVIFLSEFNTSDRILKISTSILDLILSGSAIVQYNAGVTRILFLNGFASISVANMDNVIVKEFSEIIINNSDILINELVMNSEIKNYLNEIVKFPYLEKVSSIEFYNKILNIEDGSSMNSINSINEKE